METTRIECPPGDHAELGASKADQWMGCPGSMVLGKAYVEPMTEEQASSEFYDKPKRKSSTYADEGTAAHKLLQLALEDERPIEEYRGAIFVVGENEFECDDEMIGHVKHVLDTIQELAGGGMVLAEARANYNAYLQSHLSAFGTSDVNVIGETELQVHDLKYGRGVAVSAEDNKQMKLYALGILDQFEDTLGPFEHVRMFIHQPRISRTPSEWGIPVEELKKWGTGHARSAAISVVNAIDTYPLIKRKDWEEAYLHPGEKQCRWCPAKATCPALAAEVGTTVAGRKTTIDEFDELHVPGKAHIQPTTDEWLGAAMGKADLIEMWLKAIRAEVETRLLDGTPVPGFKLVLGKQGDRAWTDKAAVEEELKKYRLKVEQMYDLKLISPTTAEKLAKSKDLGPRQWKALQDKITRAPGKPHVAPADDKRETWSPTKVTADEFDAAPADDDLC